MFKEHEIASTLAPSGFGQNVAYGLVLQHLPSNRAITLVAEKGMTIPRIGESLQIGKLGGSVKTIHHTYTASGGTPSTLNCTTWVTFA